MHGEKYPQHFKIKPEHLPFNYLNDEENQDESGHGPSSLQFFVYTILNTFSFYINTVCSRCHSIISKSSSIGDQVYPNASLTHFFTSCKANTIQRANMNIWLWFRIQMEEEMCKLLSLSAVSPVRCKNWRPSGFRERAIDFYCLMSLVDS